MLTDNIKQLLSNALLCMRRTMNLTGKEQLENVFGASRVVS